MLKPCFPVCGCFKVWPLENYFRVPLFSGSWPQHFQNILYMYSPSGPWFKIKMSYYQFTSIGNPIVEIRWSYDLIPTMGFPILVRWHLYIESEPCTSWGGCCGERPCTDGCHYISILYNMLSLVIASHILAASSYWIPSPYYWQFHIGSQVKTSCAHKWGQYTPALISTHPIKKYPTNSPIFKSCGSYTGENHSRKICLRRISAWLCPLECHGMEGIEAAVDTKSLGNVKKFATKGQIYKKTTKTYSQVPL